TNLTGTWAATTGNAYTGEIGATFSGSIRGDKIVFSSFCDYRGGIWEFIIDGDIDNPIILSTYKPSGQEGKYDQVLKEGLENKNHTILATYKGNDPTNPSPVGNGRGWV